MYTHDRHDTDGLDQWLRRRGSKVENFYQKMHVAAGPFGIGVELAHYLQVILAYSWYNVNTGIKCCSKPDFGQSMLHLEDRIQTRMTGIWGKDLFSNRTNVSQFNPLIFSSVGVCLLKNRRFL